MKSNIDLIPLPIHPQPGPLFTNWFQTLTSILNKIVPCDILSADYKNVAIGICSLKTEVIYECESRADRASTSVYDRSDYVVRELLRTIRIQNILQNMKQISSYFANGQFYLDEKGILLNDKKQVDPFLATTFLVEIPTIISLCFTAQETIGTVNMADVLKMGDEILQYGSKRISFSLQVAASQQTIFSAIPKMLTSCLENLKVLNTKLFFSVFEQEKIFQKLIEFALQANKENQITAMNNAIECMSAYIQSSQSEPDRKQLEKDPNFVQLYKRMMDEIVNPKLKENRNNRSQFRSILYFSRMLRA
ncbi:hypothetical protein M9Y10_043961 [Tritrichomonas musculus]|uniref:Uncharacterized protein n=1 Tax=Tritrichomonas musculus TaxID=1915356 RepID=A0ABR2K436_9EUKA